LWSGCGTIVGNGNSCRTSICEEQSPKKTSKSKQPEPTKQDRQDERQSDAEDANHDTAPQSNTANTGKSGDAVSTAVIKSSDLASAVFESCSPVFAKASSPALSTLFGEFANDRISLTIDSQNRNGAVSIKDTNGTEIATYTKKFGSNCERRTVEQTTSGEITTHAEEWIDDDGRNIQATILTKSVPDSSLIQWVSITVKINAAELKLRPSNL
jgi:hypothetical protein